MDLIELSELSYPSCSPRRSRTELSRGTTWAIPRSPQQPGPPHRDHPPRKFPPPSFYSGMRGTPTRRTPLLADRPSAAPALPEGRPRPPARGGEVSPVSEGVLHAHRTGTAECGSAADQPWGHAICPASYPPYRGSTHRPGCTLRLFIQGEVHPCFVHV